MPKPKQIQPVQLQQSGLGIYFKRVLEWFVKKEQPHHKEDKTPGIDFTRILPAAVMQNVLSHYLPNSDRLSMYQTSKKLNGFFQVQIDILNTLKYVAERNIDSLMALIQKNPGLLFKKGEIKAPRGQTYYNVSPYMLIKFLCDENMLTYIIPLIPERFNQVREAQNAELGRGGSDLVKLDFNPMLVSSDEFNKMCSFKTRVNISGTLTDITFPLLENPDGLLYWKDAQGKVNFYYVNQETQTVIPITPVATTPADQQALDALKDSFDKMENNSARRSTNKEHQLIAKLMQQTLHRQGIRYSDAQGNHCVDSHTPFQLINRYRTVIRLYEEAANNGQWERANHFWQKGVGRAQGEEMWLLQRICEGNPLYPLPENFDELKREFLFYNHITEQHEYIFNNGRLTERLGSDFAIYNANWEPPRGTCGGGFEAVLDGAIDLIAVCQLIEDAKIKTLGLESDQIFQLTSRLQR